jgi:predicted RNase H-like HicB family nuclease
MHREFLRLTEKNPVRTTRLTAIIEREGDGYVSLCPELDVASQADTFEQARAHPGEAVDGFLDTASAQELKERLSRERTQ